MRRTGEWSSGFSRRPPELSTKDQPLTNLGGKQGFPPPAKLAFVLHHIRTGYNQGEETWRNRIVALHRWTRKNSGASRAKAGRPHTRKAERTSGQWKRHAKRDVKVDRQATGSHGKQNRPHRNRRSLKPPPVRTPLPTPRPRPTSPHCLITSRCSRGRCATTSRASSRALRVPSSCCFLL